MGLIAKGRGREGTRNNGLFFAQGRENSLSSFPQQTRFFRRQVVNPALGLLLRPGLGRVRLATTITNQEATRFLCVWRGERKRRKHFIKWRSLRIFPALGSNNYLPIHRREQKAPPQGGNTSLLALSNVVGRRDRVLRVPCLHMSRARTARDRRKRQKSYGHVRTQARAPAPA